MTRSHRDDLIRTHEQMHGDYPEARHVAEHRDRGRSVFAEDDNFRAWDFGPSDADEAMRLRANDAVLAIDVDGGETLYEHRLYRCIQKGDLLAPPIWLKLLAKMRGDGLITWMGRWEDEEGVIRVVMDGRPLGWITPQRWATTVADIEAVASERIGLLSEPQVKTSKDFESFEASQRRKEA